MNDVLSHSLSESVVPDDEHYAALMTERQFRAIALYVGLHWSDEELQRLTAHTRRSLGKGADRERVRKCLYSAWGTEHLLRQSYLPEGVSAIGLQWAFPQAYYAVFSYVHAWLEAVGTKVDSHAKLRRVFANDVRLGKLPKCLAFYAVGGRNQDAQFMCIPGSDWDRGSLEFEEDDAGSWAHQIRQFLRTTRTLEIEQVREKREKDFKTRAGKIKRRLSRKEWECIASRCAPTTVLDLLYRKRIKANYQDVTVFSSASMNVWRVLDALITLVRRLGFFHEARLAACDRDLVVGSFDSYLARHDISFLKERRACIDEGRYSPDDVWSNGPALMPRGGAGGAVF